MHNIFRIIFFIFSILIFYNCKTTFTTAEMITLKKVISEKSFELSANSATPIGLANTIGLENLLPPGSNTSNIILVNVQNYLKVKNDSIFMDLPYYGTQQIVSGYNADSGLKFEGIPTSTSVNFDPNKNQYLLKYNLNIKNESLDIFVKMYPNKNCSISINSSHRTTISYDGFWKEIE